MYINIKVKIECGKCGSENVSRIFNQFGNKPMHCLDCGHRGDDPFSQKIMSNTGNVDIASSGPYKLIF